MGGWLDGLECACVHAQCFARVHLLFTCIRACTMFCQSAVTVYVHSCMEVSNFEVCVLEIYELYRYFVVLLPHYFVDSLLC